MRALWIVMAALLLAGCSPDSHEPYASSAPAETSESTPATSPPAGQSPAPVPASPTRNYQTDVVDYPDGFTPSIRFVDCAQPPNEFVDWMLDPNGLNGRPRRADAEMRVGAIVTSPTGEWAVFAYADPSDLGSVPPISKRAYLAPYPLAPESELILVARVRLDTGETIWGFDNFTSWRGDLQHMGRQGVEAAFTCLG